MGTIPPEEPIWCLERRPSGHLCWRRESSKVKFRFDVEVLEFTKDPCEDQLLITDSELKDKTGHHQLANMFVVCATCVAAIAVTVIVPWFVLTSA
ncbi:AAEL005314-PA [Aedes aegypti]|uniref:AAEL005314-PA n=1 Tax=Aedes aegypti TaxID=7159 RepID=Q17AE0_AEDAE|nr:AAEL005314-PA [Aedes aegypti]